jgi:hypothetical protein
MDQPDHPWPSPHIRPFIPRRRQPQSSAESLNLLDWPEYLEFAYSQGFYALGMAGVERLQDTSHHDTGLQVAVLYNFRHYLELSLKSLIRVCADLARDPIPNIANEHGLMPLWAIAKPLLAKALPPPTERDETLRHVERCLNDFHQADPSSQVFRYSTDKAGNSVRDRLPDLDLPRLVEAMKALGAFFSGCDAYADHLSDIRAEMEAECAGECGDY